VALLAKIHNVPVLVCCETYVQDFEWGAIGIYYGQ